MSNKRHKAQTIAYDDISNKVYDVNAASEVIDDLNKFSIAITTAQATRKSYIEVTKTVFDSIMQGRKTGYFTYGSPGIKVYIKGTKEDFDRKDKLTFFDKNTHIEIPEVEDD